MSECWTKSAEGERAHFGLAVYCAKRFASRGVPMEELIGEAEAALLWAAARFDPRRGVRFSTYAIPLVLGALRELCRRNAPMHVPRGELRVICAVDRLREDWRHKAGREPTLNELGEGVKVAPERLASILAAGERLRRPASPELIAFAPEKRETFENRVLIKDVVRSLGRPYAQVLWLRYFAGYSQREIADKYGASQAQVSRWEKEGKERLRRKM